MARLKAGRRGGIWAFYERDKQGEASVMNFLWCIFTMVW